MIKKPVSLAWLKPGVFAGSLTPLVVLTWRGLSGSLGANPISTALNQFGLVALDQVFDLPVIVEDVISRPFILIGFLAFCLLVPLAVTSTSGWVQRLGKRWQKLHKLAYLIVILGVIHFFMRMKSDVTQPVVYGGVAAVLLGTRIAVAVRKRKSKRLPILQLKSRYSDSLD